MSYSNFGFKSNVRSTVSQPSSSPKSSSNVVEVRVIKSIITSSDSKSNNLPVGTIIGESTSPNNIGKQFIANPLNPNITNIPVYGELVDLHKSTIPNSNGVQWLYGQPKGVYGTTSVNTNGVEPKLSPNKPTTQSTVKNYQAASLGVPVTQPTPQNTPQAQSIEDPKISSLESNPGDIIYEGRHGQSLRLGNTEKNPIVILRNGQNPTQPVSPGEQIKENIQGDMSSLYLTSNQPIPNLELTSENFISYSNKPTLPSQYSKPQSILNSDRIILNAKTDSVLISGRQSVGIFSQSSINLESSSTVIQSPNILLGDKDANEAGVKGNSLYNKLDIITTSLINLVSVLESQQIWAGGIPSPDGGENLVAAVTKKQLTDVKNTLKDILSKVVKTA